MLADNGFPNNIVIQHLQTQKLAIIDPTSGIEFNVESSFDELDGQLRSLFPDAFATIDTFPDERNHDQNYPSRVLKAQWMLVTRDRRRMVVVSDLPFPTGHDLQRFCGGSQRIGFQYRTLIFTTRHSIASDPLADEDSDSASIEDVNPPSPQVQDNFTQQDRKRKRSSTESDSEDLPLALSAVLPVKKKCYRTRATVKHEQLNSTGGSSESTSPAADNVIDLTQVIEVPPSDPMIIDTPQPVSPPELEQVIKSSFSFHIDDSLENPYLEGHSFGI